MLPSPETHSASGPRSRPEARGPTPGTRAGAAFGAQGTEKIKVGLAFSLKNQSKRHAAWSLHFGQGGVDVRVSRSRVPHESKR
ncbi:uncharacterized protein IRX2-DT isoform X2 [Eptesicus fuscus]|uniref:uncharacterized protein IRX2-DT isoform X2 n=1 Tax=Eptesicus fuscus TaxID=29078 RepID=UPI002403D0C2|nr:uncharacterized protein IRX2-DT isoform X2 [Eptesicus fuscus]